MKQANRRLSFIYFLLLTVCIGVIVNVFFVTIKKVHLRSGTSLEDYVSSVSSVEETIFASRGNIYDANGILVAQDVKTYDIICYIDSSRVGVDGSIGYVDNPLYTARMLAPILDMEETTIYEYLTSENLYQTELGAKGRNLSEEQKEEILAIEDIHGIDFRESYKRVYNLKDSFAPYLIGYAQSDDSGKLVGIMGLEEYLNEELSGIDGKHLCQVDKNGYVLPGMYEETVEAIDGYDVYLTLDSGVQNALDDCLSRLQTEKAASKAWGAVVEIKTGKILAWAQTDSFDPNELNISEYLNYGSQIAYEPGSTMKSIIYAAAMDLGVYNGETTYNSAPFCLTGSIEEPQRTYTSDYYTCINNVDKKNWGYIPLDYGLIYSSNVATATLLCDYVGVNNYSKYLESFHLYNGMAVDSDGIYENVGYSNFGLSPVDEITATYGQGSTVNMLQLLQAYTAIFGNGEMIKPYYIDKIVDHNTDTIIYEGKRNVVSTPISSASAKSMQDLLRRVVSDSEGTARHYAVDDIEVIGKTGTADFVVDGDYTKDETINSVMLAFPYEDPTYMVYVAYETEKTVYYNYDQKPIPDLISKINLIKNEDLINSEKTTLNKAQSSTMKNVISMNLEEAITYFLDNEVIVIGDGDIIMDQYPGVNEEIYSNDKIYLLTDGNNITLPDFTGWTRKEIIHYWSLSKLALIMEGYGVVKSQSILPGSIVDKDSDIILTLSDIQSDNEDLDSLTE